MRLLLGMWTEYKWVGLLEYAMVCLLAGSHMCASSSLDRK